LFLQLPLRYSPCLLVTILALLLSTHFYPIHTADFGCFPCCCHQKDHGTKHLASCSLVGVLRLKDVSLSEQDITSVAGDAFTSLWGLQRLSLSGNRLPVLPQNVFAPLDNLQLLDLGRLGLQQVESDTFAGLSSLRVLSLSQNHLKVLPADLLRPMPALEQLLFGGKIDERRGHRIVDGNELSILPQELLQHSPRLQILDLSQNTLNSLPTDIFNTSPLLQALDLSYNKLTELPGGIFSGLNKLQELDLSWNKLIELHAEVFLGLSKLQKLNLERNNPDWQRYNFELPAEIFSGLSQLQELEWKLAHRVAPWSLLRTQQVAGA